MEYFSIPDVPLASLHLLSPSEVLQSSQASESIRRFFEQSSPDECEKLLPQTWYLKVSSIRHDSRHTKRPYGDTLDSSQRLSYAQQNPLDEMNIDSTLLTNQQRFMQADASQPEKASTCKYAEKALRALRGDPPDSRCPKIWSERGEIFGEVEQSPCRRLARGRQKFHGEGPINDCVRRFISLFVSHEIDIRTTGRRNSSSVESYAAETGQSVDDVRCQVRSSHKYEELLLKIGPGILLILGTEVNHLWEKCITYRDIEQFLMILEIRHPNLYNLAVQLNSLGAEFALEGLRAYHSSSTFDILSNVESRLRLGLFKHCYEIVSSLWKSSGRDPRRLDEVKKKKIRTDRSKLQRRKAMQKAMHAPAQMVDGMERAAYGAASNLDQPTYHDLETLDPAHRDDQTLNQDLMSSLFPSLPSQTNQPTHYEDIVNDCPWDLL